MIEISNVEDTKDCLKIRNKVFIQEQGVPAEIELDVYDDICIHFLGRYQGVAACAARLRPTNDYIKFERICTLPEFRGLGCGLAIVQYMEVYAHKHFSQLPFLLYAQESVVSFYEKLNWSVSGSSFKEAGIIHYPMKK